MQRYVYVLGGFLWAQLQISANPLNGDCRLKSSDLRPLLHLENPYFYNYRWDDKEKEEVFWRDPATRITIRQRACLRHHIIIEVWRSYEKLPPAGIQRSNVLWDLLDKLFWQLFEEAHPAQQVWLHTREVLHEKLFTKLVGAVIDAVYQEWSFISQLDSDKEGACIRLEMVRLIPSHPIARPRLPLYMDDAFVR
ncbi:MAG: hypothetical protein ACUVRD_07955 [Bacteroidia bacterium]